MAKTEINAGVANALNLYQSISLAEMDSVSLMKRSDTKYVLAGHQLPELLINLSSSYRILEINNNRVSTYVTEYFDTATLKFFSDHLRGKSYRSKVRVRNYVESEISFLEVKKKDKKGNTIKTRVPVPVNAQNSLSEHHSFLLESLGHSFALEAVLKNAFNRITLVSLETQERVTIDLNISFEAPQDQVAFPGLVIVEIKQEGKLRKTPIVYALRNMKSRETSVSKYCLGVMRLRKDAKSNAYKSKRLSIQKLTGNLWK